MRITTKVIQKNQLNNINTNKLLQDKLSQQMTTGKVINRPSEDPIVAIRALRLRSNVSQVTQYYEKNAPDAEHWLEVTEGALTTMNDVVTDMIRQCTDGANEYLELEDRETILDALKALRDEVYSTGNADYAGRTLFTGYRTDMKLTFIENTVRKYSMVEQVDSSFLDEITHVESGELNTLNSTNFESTNPDIAGIVEQDVAASKIYRFRTSYDNLDDVAPKLQVFKEIDAATGEYVFEDLLVNNAALQVSNMSIYEDGAYLDVGANEVRMLRETGEILLGEDVYKALVALEDNPATIENEAEIRFTYEKSNWKDGDLRPEHYFACVGEDPDDATKTISYNRDYLQGIMEKQAIEYDVGLNQTIRVNTTADEVFYHAIGRDVDDMIRAMEDSATMLKVIEEIEGMLKSGKYTPDQQDTLNQQLEAAKKASALLNEKTQKLYEAGITKMQGHLDNLNYAVTSVGTRSKRLELVSNRLMSQQTSYETLQSENEDVDIAEVAVQLTTADLTYNTALAATGKILQTNLMNFI
ncbi:MAG: flagellar hook-associated protein FlgL [Lachnospiraceae bacterium]|nr:flagellar hook-associated protein FlgL [Lachnospiraceae bacterium]